METTKSKIRSQDVSRVLRNANVLMSKMFRGKVCYNATTGFEVSQNYEGFVVIRWNLGSWTPNREKFETETQKVYQTLITKGYVFEENNGKFIITGKRG